MRVSSSAAPPGGRSPDDGDTSSHVTPVVTFQWTGEAERLRRSKAPAAGRTSAGLMVRALPAGAILVRAATRLLRLSAPLGWPTATVMPKAARPATITPAVTAASRVVRRDGRRHEVVRPTAAACSG